MIDAGGDARIVLARRLEPLGIERDHLERG